MKILDLYCGLGGWVNGFKNYGYNDITGYDIIDFSKEYPGNFIQTDLLTYNDFPKSDIIVASPPCTDFSKSSFPDSWQSVKKFPPNIPEAIKLFNRVYEIVKISKPKYYIIENVRGSQKYMGKAIMHIGSRYFYGNFPMFNVDDTSDIYGKTKMPPSKNRASLRSKIPLSISNAFAKSVINAMNKGD